MTNRGSRARALRSVVWVAVPVGVAILLNALVRPSMADGLGGVRQRTFTSFRSIDGWWTFDEATRSAHPLLTGFLGLHDGLIAVIGLLVSAIVLVASILGGARRSRRRE